MLNRWSTGKGETAAAVSVYLSILPESLKSHAGITEYKFKRIRCSELTPSHKYPLRWSDAEALVL